MQKGSQSCVKQNIRLKVIAYVLLALSGNHINSPEITKIWHFFYCRLNSSYKIQQLS